MPAGGGSNGYVLKLTAAGAFGWVSPFVAKTAESPDSCVFLADIAVDAAGNVVVGGYYQGQVDLNPSSSVDYRLPNPGPCNGFVAKLSSGGSLAWARQTGGDCVNALAVDASGAVYATGTFGAEGFTPGSGLPAVTSNGGSDVLRDQVHRLRHRGLGLDVRRDRRRHRLRRSPWTPPARSTWPGCYSGTVDFDPDPLTTHELTNTAYDDMFLLKLRQS